MQVKRSQGSQERSSPTKTITIQLLRSSSSLHDCKRHAFFESYLHKAQHTASVSSAVLKCCTQIGRARIAKLLSFQFVSYAQRCSSTAVFEVPTITLLVLSTLPGR